MAGYDAAPRAGLWCALGAVLPGVCVGGFRPRPQGPLDWAGLASAAGTVALGLVTTLLQDAVSRLFGGVWVLWGLVAVLAVLAMAIWVLRRLGSRKAELGVVLRVTDRSVPSDQRQAAAEAQAGRHRRAVVVESDLPADPIRRERALDAVHRNLQAKIGDRVYDVGQTPVSLYLIASLPDAFGLGRRIRYDLHRRLTVMQAADQAERRLAFYPAVRLGGHLKASLGGRERIRVERFLRSRFVELDPSAPADRLALVVRLVPGVLTATALDAARAGTSAEYAVSSDHRCRAALVIEADNGLPAELASFELAVRYVCEEWSHWLAERGGAGVQSLFLVAPASVAMALGYAFARTPVRLIRHVQPTP